MPFQFCPQCGVKLQAGFRFCPSCGEKFPRASPRSVAPSESPAEEAPPPGAPPRPGASTATARTPAAPKRKDVSAGLDSPPGKRTPTPVKKTPTPVKRTPTPVKTPTHVKKPPTPVKRTPTPVKKTPTPVKGKGRAKPLRGKKEEEEEEEEEADDPLTPPSPFYKPSPGGAPPAPPSPGPPPGPASPKKQSWLQRRRQTGRRHTPSTSAWLLSAAASLQEGEELTDTAGRKWRLGKLLSRTETDLVYEASSSSSSSLDSNHVLKLGAKDGRIFNEQNFLQRAAKASTVEKWTRSQRLSFLGLPSCVGFGLHASYRFLVFPSMGQTLLSVLEATPSLPSERTVLQLACRMLDVLTFIHDNEYVHGDLSAENVYVSTEGPSQVFLAGYSQAFRYRPGGQPVAYREGSRSAPGGALDYVSVDAHKGAGPSPRSDLQSLAYCLLHWLTGALPWTQTTDPRTGDPQTTDPQTIGSLKERFLQDVPALLSSCSRERSVSSAVQQFVTMVMALEYTDTPNYASLRAGLHDALLQLGGALERPLSFTAPPGR